MVHILISMYIHTYTYVIDANQSCLAAICAASGILCWSQCYVVFASLVFSTQFSRKEERTMNLESEL